MTRRIETCSYCGKQINIGDEYYIIKSKDALTFCSCECMKEFVRENMFDEMFDDWAEENMESYDMESDDPYDRYGIDERDFY